MIKKVVQKIENGEPCIYYEVEKEGNTITGSIQGQIYPDQSMAERMVMENVFPISEICYELYKKDWKREHISTGMELHALRMYYQNILTGDASWDSYEEFVEDTGFGDGTLYVCYDEFLHTEYQDASYMEYLLQDKDMIDRYQNDIKEAS